MAKERRKWTQKEDDILKIAVGKGQWYPRWPARTPHRWASLIELDVERIDWLSIAEHLPGRNNKECRKHWHQKFATNTNYGSWTDKEDERLHMAIGQHGPSGHWWLKLSALEAASSALSDGTMCSTQISIEARGLMKMFVSPYPQSIIAFYQNLKV